MSNRQDDAPLYPEQDHMALGDFYLRHVSAMTAEGLHAKSDIAAQLAWRDQEIAALQSDIGDALRDIASLQARLDAATWQPIGMAPKDRDVWVYGLARVWTGSTPFMWQGQAGYDDELMCWVTTSHDDSGRVLNVIPTHWMPLPTAPEFA